jgi:hypothetical protein
MASSNPYAPRGQKTRKRKRLKDVEPFEVAIVPRGANRGHFVVMKEDGSMKLDLSKLSEAHAALGRIVTVCKSGTPAADTVEALNKDLQIIQANLTAMLGTGGDKPKVDPAGIKARVDEIKGIAETLDGSTYDLNMRDQIDALIEKVDGLLRQVEAMPEAPVVEAKPIEGTPEVKPAEPVTTPELAKPAEGAAAAEPAKPAEGTPVVETPPVVEAPPVAPAAPATPEVATKADLAELGKLIVGGFKEAMAEVATSLKSVEGRPQILRPAGNADEGTGASNGGRVAGDPDDHNERHWGNQFDLNADDDN